VSGDLFIAAGESLGFMQAWQSGRSVGTPGTVALYAAVNEELGRLNLAEVLAPAIELARDGFEVSPRLATFLVRARDVIRLDENPDTAAYFYPDGEALTPGTIRTNPAYAETLSRIAQQGPDAFYRGTLAQQIVDAVRAEPLPGALTLEDLADYRIQRRDALCGAVQALRVCTMPPPSSGIAELMILGLYDRLMAEAEDDSEATRWAAFVDAQRLAYADRDRYVGDPAFVAVPSRDLLDAGYLDARARQRGAPDAAPVPGDPGAVLRGEALLGKWSVDTTAPLPSTSHLSVVDAAGNAVSMTASVEAPFGSSRWAGGFLLNNQLTDFARDPGAPDAAPANGVEPGKRPRSSMSPTIVFDADGGLRMVTGSPPATNCRTPYVAIS
jgi:gamma-glutamyltranspeptidase/glutathione hydrolase